MKKRQIPLLLLAAMTLCATNAHAKSICLDAGHGGSDPGACGCSMRESENTLDSVKRLESLLKAAGWTVYQTRSTETFVDLKPRSDYANAKGVDTFASIHNNAYNGSATGIETLCQTGNMSYKSGSQAKEIQSQMVAVWSLANRGAKEQNLSVTRLTNMPATLSELAFIDNCSKDAPYLRDRNGHVQNAMRAHCKAITKLWNGSASSACSGSGGGSDNPPASSTGKLMAGTFKDTVSQANWLGGVKYTVGGKSQTSASDYKIMSFELAPGSYTATAEKSGFNKASKACEAVTAGGTAWCSIALTAAAPEPPAKGKATGSVKDGSTGKTVPATVTGIGTANYDGKTDWSFDANAGTYTLTATAEGYNNGSVQCKVESGKTASCPITITPKKGTITGQVLDKASNNAIAATVKIGDNSVQYNATGEFTFTVEEGAYTVEADADGYKHGQTSCSVKKGQSAKCNVVLETAAPDNGTLEGQIIDANSGESIPGDVKLADGQVFHYMGSGVYTFSLTPGDYAVTASADGYADYTTTCKVASNETTTCTLTLSAGQAKVSGYVYESSDKSTRVAANIYIDKNNPDNTAVYDGQNDWSMSIDPGKYTFTAETTDGRVGSATCDVVAGKDNTCNIAIGGDATGTLYGIVFDSRNKKLLLESTVEVEGSGSIKYHGKDKFYFNDLPVGDYQVTAKAYGYYNNTVVCSVNDVEPGYCEIPLTIKPADGAEATSPKIIIEDSCSATPLAQNSRSAGLAAMLLGMIAVFGIRRRKGDER